MKPWLMCLSLAVCGAAFGRPAADKLSFDVVSVKPSAPQPMNQIRVMNGSDPGMVRYNGYSLRLLIQVAYRVKEFQVQGPEWLDSARFDVEGKLPQGVGSDKVPEMLQTMLEERFKLAIHRDTKEHSILALVAGKGGPRLKKSEPLPEGVPTAGRGPGGMGGGRVMMQIDDKGAHVRANNATLEGLADMLSRFSDVPVIDKAGIEGQYDFDLVLSPEALRAGRGGGPMMMGPGPGSGTSDGSGRPADEASSGAGTIREAVQAYGLKLEPQKAAMPTIVVDHVEKTPVEN